MIYREWQLKDVGEVVELEKKCFTDPWNADMVLSSFNLPQFVGFVAEDGGKVVGYVGATAVFTDCDVLLVAVARWYRTGAKRSFWRSAAEIARQGRVTNRSDFRKSASVIIITETTTRLLWRKIYKDDDCGFKRDMRRQRQNTAYAARLRSE